MGKDVIRKVKNFLGVNNGNNYIANTSQNIDSRNIENSFIAKIDKIEISIPPSKDSSSIPLPTIQDVLNKDDVVNGMFFRKEPFWADFEQGFILERIEVNKIIEKMDKNKIQIVLGNAASGKSVVLKNIGYILSSKIVTYYIDLKRYYIDEIASLFVEIINSDSSSLFIVDDAHLNLSECEKLIRRFEKKEKGWLIIGSRDSLHSIENPKGFSQFENLEKTEIFSEDIAEGLMEAFFQKNCSFDRDRIEKISKVFSDYRKDLWLLSWALLSFDLQKNIVGKHEIYNKISESITNLGKKEKRIDAQELFLPLSVFYRFEIPIERRFLEEIGINREQINELITQNEITEDKKTGFISMFHSSIADLYFETYEEMRGLGGKIRRDYRNNLSHHLFSDYLKSGPTNFFRIFISLRRDVDNCKGGLSLVRSLIKDEEIQGLFIKYIYTEQDIGEIGFGFASIAEVENEIASNMLDKVDMEKLTLKLNEETMMGKVVLSILNMKLINKTYITKLVESLDKDLLIERLKKENLYNIMAFLSAFDDVNKNISKSIIKNICQGDKFKEDLEKTNDRSLLSICILYIARADSDVAENLIRSINIDKFFKDVKTDGDIASLNVYLYTIDVLVRNVALETFGKIDKEEFDNIMLDKNVDLFSLSATLTIIGYHNKEILSTLISEIDLNRLSQKIISEEKFETITMFISWIIYANKIIAYKLIENLINNKHILKKIQENDQLGSIDFLLTAFAYLDIPLACNAFIYAIAYSKPEVAYKLLSSIYLSRNINMTDITINMLNQSVSFNSYIELIYYGLGKELLSFLGAEIHIVPEIKK